MLAERLSSQMRALVALTLLTALTAISEPSSQSEWQVGRATFYGTDGCSIHQGSCGFYYVFDVHCQSFTCIAFFVFILCLTASVHAE